MNRSLPTRPAEAAGAQRLALADTDFVSLRLCAGDELRGLAGIVWCTIDGRSLDVLLRRDELHRADMAQTVRLSAFGAGAVRVQRRQPCNCRGLLQRLRHWLAATPLAPVA